MLGSFPPSIFGLFQASSFSRSCSSPFNFSFWGGVGARNPPRLVPSLVVFLAVYFSCRGTSLKPPSPWRVRGSDYSSLSLSRFFVPQNLLHSISSSSPLTFSKSTPVLSRCSPFFVGRSLLKRLRQTSLATPYLIGAPSSSLRTPQPSLK